MNSYIQYAEICYTTSEPKIPSREWEDAGGKVDIEDDISKEITAMKNEKNHALFQPVKIDIQCGKQGHFYFFSAS